MQEALQRILAGAAAAMQVALSEQQMQMCTRFAVMLVERNKELNLTSLVEPEEIAVKHFVDSFTCLNVGNWPLNCRAIDVGTGAGFPGLALAIIRPDIHWLLTDAALKKIVFVQEVAQELGLRRVECRHGRAEDLGREGGIRERYDVAVARALARLPVLLEYCLPLVKVGGGVVAMKGPDVAEEMVDAHGARKTLGAAEAVVKKLELPKASGARTLLWYRKVRPTPVAYPRRPGLVSKRPLT